MKKLLSLAVAAAMVTSLCACGGGSSTTATTAAAANSGSAESGSAAAADGKNYDNVTLKLSYATGDTGMDGLTAIEFERLVEEKSGGKVQINRFRTVSLAAAIWFVM